MNIVKDSKTFALLRNTIALFYETRITTTNSLIVNDLTLHRILQNMQTTIKQLQKNHSQFKSKSYTKILRIAFEFIIKSIIANKSINFKTTKQIREFMILIVDNIEWKILKIMIFKNIMNKLQIKKIRRIIWLNNDDLKIQTRFEKIKNFLQKKSEIIRRIIELIMIRIQIYAMRVNEVKIKHIDTNNQFHVIKNLQNVNASLHSSLIIKKMSWSSRIIRNKKCYFTLHMKIIIVKMINWMFFENLMKIFEIKKYKRFIKNCILRQCFNCQKYKHLKKHCRIVVVCEKCVTKHHINECDSSIIEKYKICETCENREHIAWSSKCRMRQKKAKDRTCSTNSHTIISREWIANRFQRVSIHHQFVNNIIHDFDYELENRFFEMKNNQNQKKNERLKSNIFFRIFIDFATHRVRKQYGKFSWQKFVSAQCDYEFEEHEKNIALQFDESIQIHKQIIRECERVNRDKLNDRFRFFMKNINVLIILQYNVRNEKIRTMISLFVDKNIQDYNVIAIQKLWRNFFASISLNNNQNDFHLLYKSKNDIKIYFSVND